MAEGNNTYKGLAVPLQGESEIRQLVAANDIMTFTGATSMTGDFLVFQDVDGTEFMNYDASGALNIAVTDGGVDNYVAVTLADSTTISSGYIQAFYTSLSTTGVISGGAQINAFAADVTLSGTPGVEVSGMYLYFSETGTTVVTNLQLHGVTVNFEDMGGACQNRAGYYVYSNSANLGSDIDAAFYAYCSGATGTWRALLGCGGSTEPEYFMEYTTAIGSTSRMLATYSPSDAATYALRILINGTVYNVPCVADSCS